MVRRSIVILLLYCSVGLAKFRRYLSFRYYPVVFYLYWGWTSSRNSTLVSIGRQDACRFSRKDVGCCYHQLSEIQFVRLYRSTSREGIDRKVRGMIVRVTLCRILVLMFAHFNLLLRVCVRTSMIACLQVLSRTRRNVFS